MTKQDGKVFALSGCPIASPGSPNESVVKCLEEILEQARSGEVSGIAVALQHGDGSTSTRLHGYLAHHATMGAVEYLKHRLLSDDL